MAGTARGRIDCLTNATGANTQQQNARNCEAVFRTIWMFLDAHPGCSRIASYYGDATSPGTTAPPTNARGIGYWDEAVNFGRHAFGVWRFNNALWPWYLFLELTTAEGLTYPNGSFMKGLTTDQSNHRIGMSAAWGVTAGSAVGNPWAGGSANAGGDARANGGNARWVDPGGGVYVLPRSNNLYGTHTALKNNSADLYRANQSEGTGTGHAFGVVADDDSIVLFYDFANDNTWSVHGICRYVPRDGLACARPYCMFEQSNTLGFVGQNIYGSTAGTGAGEGGIIMPDAHSAIGAMVRPFAIDRMPAQSSTTYEPNNVGGTANVFSEYPYNLFVSATGETVPSAGPIGKIDPAFLREVYNVGSMDTNAALTRAFPGYSTLLTTTKPSVPWNGITPPRTYAGATDAIKRQGVAF